MEQLKELVQNGKAPETEERVGFLLGEGHTPEAIMNEALIPAMDVVGQLFQQGEYFLPEMMVAARAMRAAVDRLRPFMAGKEVKSAGKVLMGTVRGDLHDIGKNLVIMSLEGAGFEVIDLGVDVAPEAFVEAVKEHDPQVVGISALLTTTMREMGNTVKAIRTAGRDARIMIGGAPVTQQFCDEIGADFYGHDSTSAKNYAREIVQMRFVAKG